jgi:hypothetical protein
VKDACAVTDQLLREFSGKSNALIVHPYPVTPFHGDYLHHLDLAEHAKARLADRADASSSDTLRVKADGAVAQSLLRTQWRASGQEWDVEIAEIDVAKLIASARIATNGWTGPAWLRAGWFHASLVLAASTDEEKRVAEEYVRRLQTQGYADAVERINLERSLVTTLTANCRSRVAGYTVKREYFSTIFTAGVENLGYDSFEGFNSPMFVRTVKLKDFPWNGWLALGIDARPTSAWNPIAGFTDPFGQLMWAAVGDTALIPSPYESMWMLNRISGVKTSAGDSQ